MTDRPNVLFLMDDEHRADVLGYAGDDVVRTPTLDRLADEGVVFENAYTPAPRCVPARQCLAAGQLPDSCGCRRYGDDLPLRTRTFARQFTEHGYHTVAAGKLHHPGWDKLQDWRNTSARRCRWTIGTSTNRSRVPSTPARLRSGHRSTRSDERASAAVGTDRWTT